MFTRAVLGLMLGLWVALTTITSTMLARPPDDTRIYARLLPMTNCAGPCWRAIQPGRTSAADALALLDIDPHLQIMNVTADEIGWAWRKPLCIDCPNTGIVRLRAGVVTAVVLPPGPRLGDLQLYLGPSVITGVGYQGGMARIDIAYPQMHITFTLRLACPITLIDYWNTRPEITISRLPNSGMGRAPVARPRILRLC